MENDSDDDDVCKKFDDCISAGAEYKAIKESLKIDFDTVQKQIELDELSKASEIETKQEPRKSKKNSELKKKESSSFKNGKTTDEERITGNETNKGVRTRRGRKRNSDPLDKESEEKQRHTSDSPLHIPVTPEKSNVENNFIYISSDDESDCFDISVSEEDDNYEVSVTVLWKSTRFDKFNIRRFQKLAYLFEHYSKLESVDQKQILLTLNNEVISPDDTPYSLKLTVANFIEGGVTSRQDSSKQNAVSKQQEPALSKDELELKVQRKGCREPIIIRFLKTQKMKIFMLKCAESLELPMEKLKFSFDGETINPNNTPADLDLEGEDPTLPRILGIYSILKALALVHCTLYIHYKPVVSLGICSLVVTILMYCSEVLYFYSTTLSFYVIFPCVLNALTLVGLIVLPKRLIDVPLVAENENAELLRQATVFKRRRPKKVN